MFGFASQRNSPGVPWAGLGRVFLVEALAAPTSRAVTGCSQVEPIRVWGCPKKDRACKVPLTLLSENRIDGALIALLS